MNDITNTLRDLTIKMIFDFIIDFLFIAGLICFIIYSYTNYPLITGHKSVFIASLFLAVMFNEKIDAYLKKTEN